MKWLETMSTDGDDGADDDGDDHYERQRETESRSNHARRYFNSQKLWVPLFALPCAVPHDYCWLAASIASARLVELNVCLAGFVRTLPWYLEGVRVAYRFRC